MRVRKVYRLVLNVGMETLYRTGKEEPKQQKIQIEMITKRTLVREDIWPCIGGIEVTKNLEEESMVAHCMANFSTHLWKLTHWLKVSQAHLSIHSLTHHSTPTHSKCCERLHLSLHSHIEVIWSTYSEHPHHYPLVGDCSTLLFIFYCLLNWYNSLRLDVQLQYY